MTEITDREKVEYAAAAMIDFAMRYRSQGGLRKPVAEISNTLNHDFKVTLADETVSEAMSLLTELGLAETISAGHSRPYFLLAGTQFDRRKMSGWSDLSDGSRFGKTPILSAFWKLGSPWLAENLPIVFAVETEAARLLDNERFERWAKAVVGRFPLPPALDYPSEGVPASDRIVHLNHNDTRLEQAARDAQKLAIDLVASNDIGNLSADEVAVAAREVREIAEALEGSSVRMPAFQERAISTLSWIGREAAGAVIGTAAIALLALIGAIFGLSL